MPQSYEIVLENLSTQVIIGTLPSEREQAQRVQIEAYICYERDGEAFLDYAQVRESIITHLQQARYYLLEEACDGVVAMLCARFPLITKLTLTLKKPDIFQDCCVGIRKSYP